MKDYPAVYSAFADAPTREPQYVLSIDFGAASLEYFSSHAGIPGIPAGTFDGTFKDYSSISQRVDPETGASRIGALTVMLGDIGEVVTDEFQTRLAASDGLRDTTVRLYKGFRGLAWTDFELRFTQEIQNSSERRGLYKISCNDLQRALRAEIFRLKVTTLSSTISAAATSMTVADTTGFQMVAHGTSYSHGPSATWGYVQIDDEVIGYTGLTAGTFTGLDRGLFGTAPAVHEVDPGDPVERRPEVEEYVYLEMPAVKLARALMTGELHNQPGDTLPPDWHRGIDPTRIEDAQFTSIGDDLWIPTNDSRGLIVKFAGIGSVDAKRFIETEIFRLAQIFSPVLASGNLGLKRLTPALAGAAYVATLNESNVSKFGALTYAMREVVNRAVINWSYVAGDFRRQTVKLDANSIAIHGNAPIKFYSFKGLAANSATQSVLDQRFDAIRDRFSSPPLKIQVDTSKRMDNLEIGDVVRLNLQNVRDMSASALNPIDRSFEIRQIIEGRKGPVRLSLVGSSAEATPVQPTVNALPDAFYSQAGTELSTVVPITAGVTDAGSPSLVGNASMAAGIFYYVGDLTISATTLISISQNVQLRVLGHLTVNGDFDGIGSGLAGVADVNPVPGGQAGYFGNSRAGPGLNYIPPDDDAWETVYPGVFRTTGQQSTVPLLNLLVNGNTLEGTPDDLRGTSGGPGGRVNSLAVGPGGTGGAGGAGLMIIARGLSFGGGGSIDLSGGAGLSAPLAVTSEGNAYGGGGAGGAPGALLVLLDGNQTVPVVSTNFTASQGVTPVDGNPIPTFRVSANSSSITFPITGKSDSSILLSGDDFSDSAFRVQFVPVPETPVEDLPLSDVLDNGLTAIPEFTPGLLGGSSDFVFTLNAVNTGTPNDGEIRVQGTTFEHPDGTTVTTDVSDFAIHTAYEASTIGRFYLMYSAVAAETRFGGVAFDWGAGDDTRFTVVTHDAILGWRARDNTSTFYSFTPLATDCIIAVCEKVTPSGGIAAIVPLMSGLQGGQGSTGATGATGSTGAAGNDGADGVNGQSDFVGLIYRRSASAPATPTGGQYNFSTLTLTPPTNWSTTIPAGTDPLYVSTASFSVVAPTTVDSSTTWNAPAILVQDGAAGSTGATGSTGAAGSDGADGSNGQSDFVGLIYRRSASAPATPTGGQYNFSTSTLSPPTNWFATIPAGSNPLYVSIAPFSVVAPTTVDSSTTWTAPAILVQDGADGATGATGADGADGTSTYVSTVYRRSASAPATPTGGQYNFSTSTLTPPSGWSATPPTGADPLYSSQGPWSIPGATGTDTTTTWTPPVQLDSGGATLGSVVDFTSLAISFTPPQDAFFRINSNGVFETRTGTGSYATQFTWIGNASNTAYEVKVSIFNADDNPSIGAGFDTWLPCSSSREYIWQNNANNGSSGANPTVSWRRVSDNQVLGIVQGFVEASDI